jgi:hypothetical protein
MFVFYDAPEMARSNRGFALPMGDGCIVSASGSMGAVAARRVSTSPRKNQASDTLRFATQESPRLAGSNHCRKIFMKTEYEETSEDNEPTRLTRTLSHC